MKKLQFQSLLGMAKTMQSIDREYADYWMGFQRGVRRLYHGENFGTHEEHEQFMNCADGEYRKKLQAGYHAGYSGKRPKLPLIISRMVSGFVNYF